MSIPRTQPHGPNSFLGYCIPRLTHYDGNITEDHIPEAIRTHDIHEQLDTTDRVFSKERCLFPGSGNYPKLIGLEVITFFRGTSSRPLSPG